MRKRAKITITDQWVTLEIPDRDVLQWFIDLVAGGREIATGKERTLYAALGYLIGVTVGDAVKAANRWAKLHGFPAVTVTEFYKWFPAMFSVFAGKVINGK